ncbi:hypothetical protein SAMN04487967_2554 [Natronorubrum sediminis]|uniref:Uncharacterized protein n=1 Tax=Natronorubrum sediminis TaxID=640943 RepID=A0A1H6G157_9EURY|nr:hypothetical protein [Natronorubrum sediminis]SEH16330.1 hypothetical protein SAMN04487967_2554 [Natronorubrum sediminis]
MTDRPPSPPSPTLSSTKSVEKSRTVVTTSQLANRIETTLGCRLEDAFLEEILLELDRSGYVEWVRLSRDGEYVWDLTNSADRIATTIATRVVDWVVDWLEGTD